MGRLTTLRPQVGTLARRVSSPDKKVEPVYSSPEWRIFIAATIKQRGRLCEDPRCKTPHRGAGQRIYGDHIHELRDGGALLDPANVMLRCASCHGRKTAGERNKRMSARLPR
jgi:5-methylcytosine-specific restriction protein A